MTKKMPGALDIYNNKKQIITGTPVARGLIWYSTN